MESQVRTSSPQAGVQPSCTQPHSPESDDKHLLPGVGRDDSLVPACPITKRSVAGIAPNSAYISSGSTSPDSTASAGSYVTEYDFMAHLEDHLEVVLELIAMLATSKIAAEDVVKQILGFLDMSRSFLLSRGCSEKDFQTICEWHARLGKAIPPEMKGIITARITGIKQFCTGMGRLHTEPEAARKDLASAASRREANAFFWSALMNLPANVAQASADMKKALNGGVPEAKKWLGALLALEAERWREQVTSKTPYLSETHRKEYERRVLEAAHHGECCLLSTLADFYIDGAFGFEKNIEKAALLIAQGRMQECPVACVCQAQLLGGFRHSDYWRHYYSDPCSTRDFLQQARMWLGIKEVNQTKSVAEGKVIGSGFEWPHDKLLKTYFNNASKRVYPLQAILMKVFELGCSDPKKTGLQELEGYGDAEPLLWRAAAYACEGLDCLEVDAQTTALLSCNRGECGAFTLLARLWEDDKENAAGSALAGYRYHVADLFSLDQKPLSSNFRSKTFYHVQMGQLHDAMNAAAKALQHKGYHDPEDLFVYEVLTKLIYGREQCLFSDKIIPGCYRDVIQRWRQQVQATDKESASEYKSLLTSEARLLRSIRRGKKTELPDCAFDTPRSSYRALDLICEGYFEKPSEDQWYQLLNKLCELEDKECFLLRLDAGVNKVVGALQAYFDVEDHNRRLQYKRLAALLSGSIEQYVFYIEELARQEKYQAALAVIVRARNECAIMGAVWGLGQEVPVKDNPTVNIISQLGSLEKKIRELAQNDRKKPLAVDASARIDDQLLALTDKLKVTTESEDSVSENVLMTLRPLLPAVFHNWGYSLGPETGDKQRDDCRERVKTYFCLLGTAAHNLDSYGEAAEYFGLALAHGYRGNDPLVHAYGAVSTPFIGSRVIITPNNEAIRQWMVDSRCQAIQEVMGLMGKGNFDSDEIRRLQGVAGEMAGLGCCDGYSEICGNLTGMVLAGLNDVQHLKSASYELERTKNVAYATCAPGAAIPMMQHFVVPCCSWILTNPRQLMYALKSLPPLSPKKGTALSCLASDTDLFTLVTSERETAFQKAIRNIETTQNIDHLPLLYAAGLAFKDDPAYVRTVEILGMEKGSWALAELIGRLAAGAPGNEIEPSLNLIKTLPKDDRAAGQLLYAQLVVYGDHPDDINSFQLMKALNFACMRHFACAWTCKGVLALRNGHEEEAKDCFNAAGTKYVKDIQVQAPDPEGLYMSGLLLFKSGRYRRACLQLTQAFRLNYLPAMCTLRQLSVNGPTAFRGSVVNLSQPWLDHCSQARLVQDIEALETFSEPLIEEILERMRTYAGSTDPQVIFYLIEAVQRFPKLQEKISLIELVDSFHQHLGLAHAHLLAVHPHRNAVVKIIQEIAGESGKDYSQLLKLLTLGGQPLEKEVKVRSPEKTPAEASPLDTPESSPATSERRKRKKKKGKGGAVKESSEQPSLPVAVAVATKEQIAAPVSSPLLSDNRVENEAVADPEPISPPSKEEAKSPIEMLPLAGLVESLNGPVSDTSHDETSHGETSHGETLHELNRRYHNNLIPNAELFSVCCRVMEFSRQSGNRGQTLGWLKKAYQNKTNEGLLQMLQREMAEIPPRVDWVLDLCQSIDFVHMKLPLQWRQGELLQLLRGLSLWKADKSVQHLNKHLLAGCYKVIRSAPQAVTLPELCMLLELDSSKEASQVVAEVACRRADVMKNDELRNTLLQRTVSQGLPEVVVKLCDVIKNIDPEQALQTLDAVGNMCSQTERWWELYRQCLVGSDRLHSLQQVDVEVKGNVQHYVSRLEKVRVLNKQLKKELWLVRARLNALDQRKADGVAKLRAQLQQYEDVVAIRCLLDKAGTRKLNEEKKKLKNISAEQKALLSEEDLKKIARASMTDVEWKKHLAMEEQKELQRATIAEIERAAVENTLQEKTQSQLRKWKQALKSRVPVQSLEKPYEAVEVSRQTIELLLWTYEKSSERHKTTTLLGNIHSHSCGAILVERLPTVVAALCRSCIESMKTVHKQGELKPQMKNLVEQVIELWGRCGLSQEEAKGLRAKLISGQDTEKPEGHSDQGSLPAIHSVSPDSEEPVSHVDAMVSASGSTEEVMTDAGEEELITAAKQSVASAISRAQKKVAEESETDKGVQKKRSLSLEPHLQRTKTPQSLLEQVLSAPIDQFSPDLCEELLAGVGADPMVSRGKYFLLSMQVYYKCMRYYHHQNNPVQVCNFYYALGCALNGNFSCLSLRYRNAIIEALDAAYEHIVDQGERHSSTGQRLLMACNQQRLWNHVYFFEQMVDLIEAKGCNAELYKDATDKIQYIENNILQAGSVPAIHHRFQALYDRVIPYLLTFSEQERVRSKEALQQKKERVGLKEALQQKKERVGLKEALQQQKEHTYSVLDKLVNEDYKLALESPVEFVAKLPEFRNAVSQIAPFESDPLGVTSYELFVDLLELVIYQDSDYREDNGGDERVDEVKRRCLTAMEKLKDLSDIPGVVRISPQFYTAIQELKKYAEGRADLEFSKIIQNVHVRPPNRFAGKSSEKKFVHLDPPKGYLWSDQAVLGGKTIV
ncbi:hypothetical protein [Parendozoicomonas sp. Alg238-R29]|uniref:hypothetical protein n=1 Tax=Parendozoicomonas sp. Alg238-R29 TaxID=2993446 RepID=UPI00248DF750|nr:hypothetical protein [Parendozoicomonas sp. Alg238-R29]